MPAHLLHALVVSPEIQVSEIQRSITMITEIEVKPKVRL